MVFTKKQIIETVDYWKNMAEHDWKTAQSLWSSKRYDACLFYCHITIEKFLKGLVAQKTKKVAPYTHDLVELLRKTGIKISEEQINKLAVFTSFNMRCRYPRDKFAFYKLCTRNFTEPYFMETKKIILWLKKFYQEEK